MFNSNQANVRLRELRSKLPVTPDQSWRETLRERWCAFRRAQIKRQYDATIKLLELEEAPVGADLDTIYKHGLEQIAHLDLALVDVEAIARGEKEIADPYFCEGILQMFKEAGGTGA